MTCNAGITYIVTDLSPIYSYSDPAQNEFAWEAEKIVQMFGHMGDLDKVFLAADFGLA